MKTIIAGSREGVTLRHVEDAVASCGWRITSVVSGGCRGADKIGEFYAEVHGIPVQLFPADWSKHGRMAGPIRNRQMAENAEALIAVWDGKSRGTQHMIKTANQKGLKVFVHRVRELDLQLGD